MEYQSKPSNLPEKKQESAYLLFYVRHAQREDELLQNKLPDPKITDAGKEASRVTGAFLKSLCEAYAIDQVVIECSPFLRAMQTAAEISQQIVGLENSMLTICNTVHELLITPLFPTNPYRKMALHSLREDIISTDYLGGVKIDPERKQRGWINYPESVGDAHQRIEWHINSTIEKSRVAYRGKRVAHIFVTHQFLTKHFRGKFMNEYLPRSTGQPNDVPCENCCISGGMVHEKGDREILFDCDSSHLK